MSHHSHDHHDHHRLITDPDRALTLLSHWAVHLNEHAAELVELRQNLGSSDDSIIAALRDAEDKMTSAGASLANAVAELQQKKQER